MLCTHFFGFALVKFANSALRDMRLDSLHRLPAMLRMGGRHLGHAIGRYHMSSSINMDVTCEHTPKIDVSWLLPHAPLSAGYNMCAPALLTLRLPEAHSSSFAQYASPLSCLSIVAEGRGGKD